MNPLETKSGAVALLTEHKERFQAFGMITTQMHNNIVMQTHLVCLQIPNETKLQLQLFCPPFVFSEPQIPSFCDTH